MGWCRWGLSCRIIIDPFSCNQEEEEETEPARREKIPRFFFFFFSPAVVSSLGTGMSIGGGSFTFPSPPLSEASFCSASVAFSRSFEFA